jgi:outer membrane protein assembly factor BamB
MILLREPPVAMPSEAPLTRRTALQALGAAAGVGLVGTGTATHSRETDLLASAASTVDGTTDWPQFQGNAAKTGVAGGGPTSPDVRWEYDPEQFGYGQPAVRDGMVYVGYVEQTDEEPKERGIVALTTDGEVQWRYRTDPNTRYLSGPSVSDDFVFFGGLYRSNCPPRGAILIALDAETGEEVYRRIVDAPIAGAPTIADGMIYTVAPDSTLPEEGLLVAHEATTGEELWRMRTGPTGSSGYTSPPVAVADGQVYLVKDSLVALDAMTGEEVWTSGGDKRLKGDHYNVPAVVGGTVYVGTGGNGGEFYAFSTDDGSLEWTFEAGADQFDAAAVTDDTVYVPVYSIDTPPEGVHALSTDDGSEQWFTDESELPLMRPPIRGEEYVYVGPAALSPEDGSVAWTVDGDNDSTAVAGDTLYLGGESLVAVGGE